MERKDDQQTPLGGLMEILGSWSLRRCEWEGPGREP